MSLQALSQQLASRGRDGDSMLVHMTPGEVQGLQALAMAHGGSLTINPDTGLPEAGFLKKILPTVAGAALSFMGVPAPLAAGLVGGGTLLASGSLEKGLMAGLGAYGGAGLTAGLSGLGAQQLAAQQAAQQAAQFGAEAGIASYAPTVAPTGLEALRQGAQTAMASPEAFMSQLGGPMGTATTVGSAAAPFLSEALQPKTPAPLESPIQEGKIRPMQWTDRGWVAGEPYSPTAEDFEERWRASMPSGRGFALGGQIGMQSTAQTPQMTMGQMQDSFNRYQSQLDAAPQQAPSPAAAGMQSQMSGQFDVMRTGMGGTPQGGQIGAAPQQMPATAAGAQTQAQQQFNPMQAGLAQAQMNQRFNAMRAGMGGGGAQFGRFGGTPPRGAMPPRPAFGRFGGMGRGFAEGGAARMNRFAPALAAINRTLPYAQSAQRFPVPGMTGQSAQAYRYLMGQGPAPAQIRPVRQKIEEPEWIKKKREEDAAKAAATTPAAGAMVPAIIPGIPDMPAGSFDPGNISGATGGLAALAAGKRPKQGKRRPSGRYLRGPGDGTSDSIPASIEGKHPARLADGEFVIDARTVSEIGNGSSEAGAKKLYAMMDRVHAARKGAQRGKPSGADQLLPA